MNYDSQGYLEIHSYTAGGALPTPGVNIRITGSEEGNRGVDISVYTNNSGITEIVTLPVPSSRYSQAPGALESPYAQYDVEVSGTGFYPKKLVGVAVFDGIKSILPIEMIPNSDLLRNTKPPVSSNYSIIYENEELE